MSTPNIFLISDTHFGHSKLYQSKCRPWASAEEGDEVMVERWNAVVRPCDKVYHLGDVAMPRSGVKVLDRLNGDKVLIAGNHDSIWMTELQKRFRAVRAYWKLDNVMLSHIPIHPNSLRNFDGNIHGHLHHSHTELPDGRTDFRYVNVCVEVIDYTPIAWEEAIVAFGGGESARLLTRKT